MPMQPGYAPMQPMGYGQPMMHPAGTMQPGAGTVFMMGSTQGYQAY